MSDFGTVALICSLALSLYGVVVPHFGVRSNNWNLVRSVQHASILSFLMISVASAVLMEALINSDFSIEYVWGHSSRDMPLFYKITSFWGGLEGSLLFWILVQSFFIMIVAFRYQYTNREIIPYVLATLNGIMSFLLILMILLLPLLFLLSTPCDGDSPSKPLSGVYWLQHPICFCHGRIDSWKTR